MTFFFPMPMFSLLRNFLNYCHYFQTQWFVLSPQSQSRKKQGYFVWTLYCLRRKFTIFNSTQINHWYSWCLIFPKSKAMVLYPSFIFVKWVIDTKPYLFTLCWRTHFKLWAVNKWAPIILKIFWKTYLFQESSNFFTKYKTDILREG